MGQVGLPEIIIIVFVVLLIFGSKRIPEIGRAFGKALKEFKNAGKENGKGQLSDDSDKKDETVN